MDVCSIYGTDTLVKIFEVGASKDHLHYQSPVHWKMYLCVVERRGQKEL